MCQRTINNLLIKQVKGKQTWILHFIFLLQREIDFKDKLLSAMILDLRNLVEMDETKSLVDKIENNDWKFMHFFASCVLGAGINSSTIFKPCITSLLLCVIVVMDYTFYP